jgi:hypothetical protein
MNLNSNGGDQMETNKVVVVPGNEIGNHIMVTSNQISQVLNLESIA